MEDLTIDRVKAWAGPGEDAGKKKREIAAIIAKFANGTFPVLEDEVKKTFVAFACSAGADAEILQLCLQLLRIVLRNKTGADLDCHVQALEFLLALAALVDGTQTVGNAVMAEAEKCLVNLLFNSAKARAVFQREPFDKLLARISVINDVLSGQPTQAGIGCKYLSNWSASELEELLLYDLKIVFVVTAQVRKLQEDCVNDSYKTLIFQRVVATSLERMRAMPEGCSLPLTLAWKWLNEALKILFNFYHKAKMFDLDVAQQCADECAKIVEDRKLDQAESKQNAVNLLAVIPTTLIALCPRVGGAGGKGPAQEGWDMRFVEALLEAFEWQVDKRETEREQTLAEHLAMFLTILNFLCTEHKAARRFCRLKVIPPLKAEDVGRRPDEGTDFRNKIVRLMMDTGKCGELAAEFLFILCKRSVGRLVKYCGFGHSAGLLANYGFLGQALGPKHESDSEDSETEEYREVEEKINPVTGHIPPAGQLEELQKQLESMSEEQKEFEVMKLVEAMDKLMDQGLIAPGTIGQDGRPCPVKHVAELIKDMEEEEDGGGEGD